MPYLGEAVCPYLLSKVPRLTYHKLNLIDNFCRHPPEHVRKPVLAAFVGDGQSLMVYAK